MAVTVVSLVCEDLAGLDEVAELLRAIGPTLVITTLLDGPLRKRAGRRPRIRRGHSHLIRLRAAVAA